MDATDARRSEESSVTPQQFVPRTIANRPILRVKRRMSGVGRARYDLPVLWSSGTSADVIRRIAAPMIGASSARSSPASACDAARTRAARVTALGRVVAQSNVSSSRPK